MRWFLNWCRQHPREAALVVLGVVNAWSLQNRYLLALGLAPLLVLECVPAWRHLWAAPLGMPPRRWMTALVGFLAVFFVATSLRALDRQNRLEGYDPLLPRNWLGTAGWGDWRYEVMRRSAAGPELAVLTLDPVKEGTRPGPGGAPEVVVSLPELVTQRLRITTALRWLAESDAAGVALDYYFPEPPAGVTEAQRKQLDVMNSHVAAAVKAFGPGKRVFVGYGHTWDKVVGNVQRVPNVASISHRGTGLDEKGRFGADLEGHLVVFEEGDGRVRSMPLAFAGDRGGGDDDVAEPSLAYLVARHLRPPAPGTRFKRPRGDLLYLIPPARGPQNDVPHLEMRGGDPTGAATFAIVRGGQAVPVPPEDAAAKVARKFVIVGSRSARDSFLTPIASERIPGVRLHAYAVETLLDGNTGGDFVARVRWCLTLLALLLPLLGLAYRLSRGDGVVSLALSVAACNLAWLAVATVAIFFNELWIDVVFVAGGLWAFLLVGLVARPALGTTPTAVAERPAAAPVAAVGPPPGPPEAGPGGTIDVRGLPIAPLEKPVQRAEHEVALGPALAEVRELIRVAEARREFGVSGAGQAVAVLDTGLRASHLDFAGRVPVQRNFTTDNGGKPDDASDGHGHGTNVAGIVAAGDVHQGVAPQAQIVPVKVLPNDGSGSFDSVLDALRWVRDQHAGLGISAVCMSLGDGRNHTDDAGFSTAEIVPILRELRAARVAVVVASGNDYFRHKSKQGMSFPAILRECIAVGAVYDAVGPGYSYGTGARSDSSAPDRLTPFAQRLHESANAASYTHVFAPGAPTTSAGIASDAGDSTQQGTSQAAPVVAGVVALLQEYARSRTGALPEVDALIRWMRDGGVEILDGDDEADNVEHTGLRWRRVDALGALRAARREMDGAG